MELRNGVYGWNDGVGRSLGLSGIGGLEILKAIKKLTI